MKALVLEPDCSLNLREIDPGETLGPRDVRIEVRAVGVCGSDLHYYEHGRLGPFEVKAPMILGHEAAGTVSEVGDDVTEFKPGDSVCMEPGVPLDCSRETWLGRYNLDSSVRFWATPPVHGVLRESVIHPADFTYKLPPEISLEEGAMVEPLAVGMHAVNKAGMQPGDVTVVIGAGTIGLTTAQVALAAGSSCVVIADMAQPRLDLAAGLGSVVPVNVRQENLAETVRENTAGHGADALFECSGSADVAEEIIELMAPAGKVTWVGMPGEKVSLDIVAAQAKELRFETVFRYAHVYSRALALMAAGRIDVKPLITDTFPFDKAVEAFKFAADMPERSVKLQVVKNG